MSRRNDMRLLSDLSVVRVFPYLRGLARIDASKGKIFGRHPAEYGRNGQHMFSDSHCVHTGP